MIASGSSLTLNNRAILLNSKYLGVCLKLSRIVCVYVDSTVLTIALEKQLIECII